MKTKDITLIALLTSILFVQEQLLTFIPNVQFTTLLIILYTKLLGGTKTSVIVLIHVILDNLFMGFEFFTFTFMLLAWLLIPLFLSTVFRKQYSIHFLSIFALIFGFVYGFVLMPAGLIVLKLPFLAYLIADIPFQIIMAMSNFITVLLLYETLYERLKPHVFDMNKSE